MLSTDFFAGAMFIALIGLAFGAGYISGTRGIKSDTEQPSIEPTRIFGSRKNNLKRKPVFVSEADQWKREQKMPPLDPGL